VCLHLLEVPPASTVLLQEKAPGYPTNRPSAVWRAWPSVTSVSSNSVTQSGGAAAKAAATWAALAWPDRSGSPARRARQAGLPETTCCHTFRATEITTYLRNGGTIEHAQQIANHESPRTTKLYDRTNDAISLDEIERIII